VNDVTQAKSDRQGVSGWCRLNVHFLIAAVILAVAAAGWNAAISALEWALDKEPVPWPAGVRVHEKHFNLMSLPDEVPDWEGKTRFAFIKADSNNDGRPDGELLVGEEQMALLKIGTPTDKKRWPLRRSNWYCVRRYEDVGVEGSRRRWQLACYYYTGMLDPVPHVGERCLLAAGASFNELGHITFDVPEAPQPWKGKVVFRKILYEKNSQQYATYYTFSLNGRPEPDWKIVRFSLMKPWVRYCYFAKIEFGPDEPVVNPTEADQWAREFIRCFLPKVLETLPMPADVEKARIAGQSK